MHDYIHIDAERLPSRAAAKQWIKDNTPPNHRIVSTQVIPMWNDFKLWDAWAMLEPLESVTNAHPSKA